MRDEIIHFAAYVDAGLATGVKDEEIVLGWKLLVFEDIVTGRKLFFSHRIGQSQGFILRQAQIAVLSIDQKQCFAR